jgi:hypothetical protein
MVMYLARKLKGHVFRQETEWSCIFVLRGIDFVSVSTILQLYVGTVLFSF